MARRMGEEPLPRARRMAAVRLSGFRGLDLRPCREAGAMADGEGVDPRLLPAVVSMRAPFCRFTGAAGVTLGMEKIGESLFRVYLSGASLYLERHRANGSVSRISFAAEDTRTPRTLLAFHLYSDPADPLTGEYRRLGILLPDRLVFEPEAATLALTPLAGEGEMPALTHGCVHLSRLFGAAGDRLFASAYNDPRNWQLDTANEMNPAGAWAAAVQSNTRADANFTALTVYGGHVLAFKQNFCHVLNNNKNPFRTADLMPYGTRDGRTLAEVGGKLFFVSDEGVCRYNGDAVTLVSEPLGEVDMTGACAAGARGLYWLYLPARARVYVYAEETQAWSALPNFAAGEINAMCGSEDGCYLVERNGRIYLAEAGGYGAFSLTTGSLLQEALGRAARLALAVPGAGDSALLVSYIDTSGRITPLAQHTGQGMTQWVRSRVFTPADYGGSLQISGYGQVTVHDICLRVAESGET